MSIAYTIKRKHNCSVHPLELWRNSIRRDFIAMLFLLTAFALESDCKNTKNIPFGKIFFKMPFVQIVNDADFSYL